MLMDFRLILVIEVWMIRVWAKTLTRSTPGGVGGLRAFETFARIIGGIAKTSQERTMKSKEPLTFLAQAFTNLPSTSCTARLLCAHNLLLKCYLLGWSLRHRILNVVADDILFGV